MTAIGIPIMAIVVAAVLIGMTTIGIQQASAFIDPWLKDFKKLTNEFERNVIGGQWHSFELLRSYSDSVMRIFPPDPTLLGLLEEYQQGVTMIFEQPPPEYGKPHELIKDFRGLTHDFIKDVVDAASTPPPDDG